MQLTHLLGFIIQSLSDGKITVEEIYELVTLCISKDKDSEEGISSTEQF